MSDAICEEKEPCGSFLSGKLGLIFDLSETFRVTIHSNRCIFGVFLNICGLVYTHIII